MSYFARARESMNHLGANARRLLDGVDHVLVEQIVILIPLKLRSLEAINVVITHSHRAQFAYFVTEDVRFFSATHTVVLPVVAPR